MHTPDFIQPYSKTDIQMKWPDGEEPTVLAWDESEGIYLVFIELLKNALQALPKTEGFRIGKIRIEGKKEGNKIRVLITNDGHPQPELDSEKIFIPHAAGHSVEEADIILNQEGKPIPISGFGIGLFHARLIAEMHGGTVEYAPEINACDATTVATVAMTTIA